jgi:2-keto-4-pentenoate hydratase/2-oxohepta-3-ene-1,7-dioic acid hydratase in catechol pathway
MEVGVRKEARKETMLEKKRELSRKSRVHARCVQRISTPANLYAVFRGSATAVRKCKKGTQRTPLPFLFSRSQSNVLL